MKNVEWNLFIEGGHFEESKVWICFVVFDQFPREKKSYKKILFHVQPRHVFGRICGQLIYVL